MKTTKTVSELRTLLSRVKGPIGLVPTMGAIHEGHVALLKKARTDCSTVVATIFSNPNQFYRTEDYVNYPQALTLDIKEKENQLVFNFSNEGDLRKLISTVDEVLEHVNLSMEVIK